MRLVSLIIFFKITKHLNYHVTFNSINCVFQDNLTKMTTSIGKERGGLYYLEGVRELQFEFDHIFQVAKETFDREKILLWYYQLGHPKFSYLECLFHQLSQKFLISSLRCEQRIYAKNHRVPFKMHLNISLIPFTCFFTNT